MYQVNRSLLDQIQTDFNALSVMDSTRITFLSTGHGQLSNIGHGDLAALLGFLDEDVILSVSDGDDTVYLNGWADYLNAAATFASAEDLSVTVYRESQAEILEYAIID